MDESVIYWSTYLWHHWTKTGDLLGLNSILGYVESFSENYYCRMCLTDKVSAQSSVKMIHDCGCILNQPMSSSTNILWSTQGNVVVKGSNVTASFTSYVILAYQIILCWISCNKNFNSTENILQCVYAYGFMDKKCPTCINLFSAGIGLNACQKLYLIRNIPLTVDDVVPQGDRHWYMPLLLVHIAIIEFSQCVTYRMTIFETSHWRASQSSRYDTLFWVYTPNWTLGTWLQNEIWSQA